MRKFITLNPLLLLLLLLPLAANGAPSTLRAQEDNRPPLDVNQVPVEGRTAQTFVPRGWKIERQMRGDLNGDKLPDIVLQLIEDVPPDADGTINIGSNRALVILATREDGSLWRVAAATHLLLCRGCAGLLDDPLGGNVVIKITRGVLTVAQLRGSREATEATLRFRYDARLKRFSLIGEDVLNYDRAVGDRELESSNYLTGVKTTKTYRYQKRLRDAVLVSTRRQRISTAKRYLEDVDREAAAGS